MSNQATATRKSHADGAHPRTERPAVILNVEDFEPARFLRSRVLRDAGFEVIEARCAGDAMAAAAVRPQLALIDIHLPDADGYDLCKALKIAHPAMPILLISAVHVTSSARAAAIDAGAHDFLAEPVTAKDFIGKVNAALFDLRHKAGHWVVTDGHGVIVDVSPAMADLLHLSAPHLRGREIINYFARDRLDWHEALQSARDGTLILGSVTVRPRERRTVDLDVELTREESATSLRWTFRGRDGG